MGLCAVACARLFTPGRIILVDLEDYRLEMGQQMGADYILNSAKVELKEEIKRITGRTGVDIALDAVGLPSTLDLCSRLVVPNGIVSVIGIGPYKFEAAIGRFFMKNLTLKTGLVPLNEMSRLLKLIELGKLDLSGLITHEVPLSDIVDAYHIFNEKRDGCIKVMVRPD